MGGSAAALHFSPQPQQRQKIKELSEASLTWSQQAWCVTRGQSLALFGPFPHLPNADNIASPGAVRIQVTNGRGRLTVKWEHCLGAGALGTRSRILRQAQKGDTSAVSSTGEPAPSFFKTQR